MGNDNKKCDKKRYLKPPIHYWKNIKNSLFFVFIASFFWLLFRTGKKPSRITYPCQKAAAINVISLLYLVPLLYIPKIKKFFNKGMKKKVILKYFLVILVLFLLFEVVYIGIININVNKSWKEYNENKIINPTGLGLYPFIDSMLFYQSIPSALNLPSPHRVVSVHNSQSTSWTGSQHPYNTMNQSEINIMVERGVISLTGESNTIDAWNALIPYQVGESVVIKVNFNNAWDCNDFTSNPWMNPYPELVNSVIDGLKSIGIPSDKIWITDPSRPVTDAFRAGITDSNVLYYTKCSAAQIGARPNVFTTGYVSDGSIYSSQGDRGDGVLEWINPADVFVNASHIINMPQLKGHGGASITLGMKNHFGSVDFTEFSSGGNYLHDYFYVGGSNYNSSQNILADMSNNPVFFNKTRLVLGDGLMGHPIRNYVNPVLFQSFGYNPPELLFFGVDPVAVDSVMFDYLQRECNFIGEEARNDDILNYAALTGMGVFEHWDNDNTRQYSSIDYIEIDCDDSNCDSIPSWDVDESGNIDISDLVIVGQSFGRNDCGTINNWCNRTDVTRGIDGSSVVDIRDLVTIGIHFS
ncbi:DUF362 domain-containing protein [Candidatus Pacearchaeota archaeon]|nr:DUF362 domain-containing protein [Candidatus Pacearchaeota archaeon]